MSNQNSLYSQALALGTRIAEALERMAPSPCEQSGLTKDCAAALWTTAPDMLSPVQKVNALPLELIRGINDQKRQLEQNTANFAKGYAANNVLLWGARGTGKSSLIKAVCLHIRSNLNAPLVLVEIDRREISSLSRLLRLLSRDTAHRFVVFCDDLSFENDDGDYKALKAILEGGIEGRPENVLFYATSNRRHLMSRQMIENERSTAIHPSEATEEKVALSDRFGLWLGFHNIDQDTYLEIVDSYADYFNLVMDNERQTLHAQALEWATTRGARSGRVAWQFITHLAGEKGKRVINLP